MPKVRSSTSIEAAQAARTLKRNQACHQCRRRKLKCDAKRPCTTCVRSHAYALSHVPAGVTLPAQPECTYDEGSDTTSEQTDAPKKRYERLESRINELEAMLRERDLPLQPVGSPGPIAGPSSQMRTGDDDFDFVNAYAASGVTADLSSGFPSAHVNSPLDSLAGAASLMGSSPDSMANTTNVEINPSANLPFEQSYDLYYSAWPPTLPDMDTLRHLVDAFFAFHLHARRLFHAPTFMASLALPPSHPRFPRASILHMICAIGSLYTASIPPTPLSTNENAPYELFAARIRRLERRPDSFAEQQAKYAKDAIEADLDLGQDMFQCVQAQVLLTWFYWCHGRWSEAFRAVAQSLRITVPCGLNVCPPFHTIQDTFRPPALLPAAKTVIEDEERRNTFWLAYAIERQMGTGNAWALSLDDQDVCQLLPIREDQFEQGTLVHPSERQWSHDKDLLLMHPEGQVDSFILYIKATMLLSRVKNFNLRFKAKQYAGEFSATPQSGVAAGCPDVIDTPAFQELDQLLTSFKASVPAQFRNPVKDQSVDPYLYTACLIPHLAQILLHEPHSRPGTCRCPSAAKILESARAIVNHIYEICATSYDVALLGCHAIVCWFMAGRVLVRFLKAALDAKSQDHVRALDAEISFIRSMIAQAGYRIPHAHRYEKMLSDYLGSTCGPAFAQPLAHPFPPKNIPSFPVDSEPMRSTEIFMQYKAPPMAPPRVQRSPITPPIAPTIVEMN